jgi:hypothetical protein
MMIQLAGGIRNIEGYMVLEGQLDPSSEDEYDFIILFTRSKKWFKQKKLKELRSPCHLKCSTLSSPKFNLEPMDRPVR